MGSGTAYNNENGDDKYADDDDDVQSVDKF